MQIFFITAIFNTYGDVVVRPIAFHLLRFLSSIPSKVILMWTRAQSSCEKSIVNALPKVVDFLPVLWFRPMEKVDLGGLGNMGPQ